MASEVRPLGGCRYDVYEPAYILGEPGHIVWTVMYQPSDRWKPEISGCNCDRPKPCAHVAAVIEWRRQEGEG